MSLTERVWIFFLRQHFRAEMCEFTFLQGYDRRKSCNWLERPVLDVNTNTAKVFVPMLEKQCALSLDFSHQHLQWPISTTQALNKRLKTRQLLKYSMSAGGVGLFKQLGQTANPREEETCAANVSVCLSAPWTFSPDITSSGQWVTSQRYFMSRLPAILFGTGEQHKEIPDIYPTRCK